MENEEIIEQEELMSIEEAEKYLDKQIDIEEIEKEVEIDGEN